MNINLAPGAELTSARDQVAAALRDAYTNHAEHQQHLTELRNRAERLRRELAGVEADLLTSERMERRAAEFVGEVFDHYRALSTNGLADRADPS